MPPPRRPDPKAAAAGPGSKQENIYIPSFISKRPFYAGEEGDPTDYLEHQRLQKKDDSDDSKWYARGRRAGPAATKYRKGACENCGAMTHKAKDCLSRPRAKGAKWTGKDIEADEVVQDINMGWDAKRDRWNGFDARDYRAVVEEYNEMDELRKRAQQTDKDADGGDAYAEELDPTKHQSTATRQLRIREDTAKYLLNLDVNSATYNPKTRALVNAGEVEDDKAASVFAEEGFLKASGDAAEFEQAQRYAWEAQEASGDTGMHLQANPTAGAFYRKKEQEAADKVRAERQKALLDRYGADGADGLQSARTGDLAAALQAAAVTESEQFVEYDESGAIKGAPKAAAKSKYAEDIYPGNHTSVWGSWWNDSRWGFACCRSFIKNSYCTGEAGVQAWEASERQRTGAGLMLTENGEEEGEEGTSEQAGRETLLEAKAKDRQSRKRPAVEMTDGLTELELDEYRKKRTAADDPMAKLLGKDELL